MLNSGHARATAKVMRCVGQEITPQPFPTWCPKALAAIGELPETLDDRAIIVRLQRRLAGEEPHRLPPQRLGAEDDPFAILAAKCVRWAADQFEALSRARPSMPKLLPTGRPRDSWRPLFAIADACGDAWAKTARKAAVALTDAHEDEGITTVLLGDLRELYAKENAEYLKSAFIVEQLAKMEDRPWADYRNGRALTATALARLLKPFGVLPMRAPVRRGLGSERVYRLAHLRPVFARYLPPDEGTGGR